MVENTTVTAPAADPKASAPTGQPSALQPGEFLMPAAKVQTWIRRKEAALEATKPAIEQGKINVQRYTGKYLDSTPKDDECLVPTDFYYVESKKQQLFYRLPEVFLKPQRPGLDDAAVVFQAALNEKLGPQGVNVLPTVQQVIFDVICPTGFGGVAIGHETIVDGEVDVPLGMDEMGQPMTGKAPNIVATRFFVSHIKPGDLLIPADFVGMDFDKAPWIGQRFREDVPEGDESGGSDAHADDRRLTPLSSGAQAGMRKQRTGYEIWYRACEFDADVKHPDKIRYFKMYDDERDKPVIVKDHPHQRYATPAGKLAKGMRGYGIKPVTLRYVSDTWMAPSDATMARNTADELSKGRTQMLRSRDRNMPQWGYDATRVDKDIQGKIERNEIQGGIAFNGPGQDATWPITKGTAPKETYQFNDVAQRDLERIWRMGDNQLGVISGTGRTATEQQITQNAAQSGQEADRAVFLNWFTQKIAAEFAALMQLYCTEQEFVELVGADAQRLKSVPPEVQKQAQAAGQDGRVLVPWNLDSIAGPFTFGAKPNSQVFVDTAQETKRMMDTYQFFANSPNVNKAEMERQILARQGYDTSRIMQQPPPKQANPPAVALSVKGEDFNPQMPQSPILLDALSKLGVPIDMAAVQAAQALAAQLSAEQITAEGLAATTPQTEHGGAAAKAEPLSKHAADATGGMQGSGAPAPMGPGGQL